MTTYFPWVLYFLAWIFTLTAVKAGASLPATLLFYVVIFNGGVQGLWSALGHLAFPKETAKKIGWTSNGFQVEIGFTNLGMGIAGVLTYFIPSWAAPIGLFVMIFYGGCAYNHIKERIFDHNNAPCNSGPMMYSTIITVATLAFCLLDYFFV